MEYTEATFNKIRKFLGYSYRYPQIKYDDLMEIISPILKKNEEDDSAKPHDPKNEITGTVDYEVYDYNESFLRNPNPYRSIIFKWENISENPFHCFWEQCSFSDKNKGIFKSILNENLQDKYFTIEEFGDEASKTAGTIDNSLAGKELRKIAGQGAMKTFSVKKINQDFHRLNFLDTSFEKEIEKLRPLISDFSKTGPCSVIGSFILNRFCNKNQQTGNVISPWEKKFLITSLDSQVMYDIFNAITDRQRIRIKIASKKYSHLETDYLNIDPLFVVRSFRTGVFSLIYKKNLCFGICDISKILEVTKTEEDIEDFKEKEKSAKNTFSMIWDFPKNGPYVPENAQRIFVEIRGAVTKEDRERFAPLHIISEVSKFTVSGSVLDARQLLPEIRRYIGRINKIKINKPVQERTNLNLYQSSLYFDFRDIFNTYGIKLDMEFMVSGGDYEPIYLRESWPDLMVSEHISPYKISEKEFVEKSSLFNYLYSRDFIEFAKKENAEIPVTAPELRWLYSVLKYETQTTDVQSEFLTWLEGENPKKLFSSDSFKSIRKSHLYDVYENLEGEVQCDLSLNQETILKCSELFNIFPEARKHLGKDNSVTTSFHYEMKDEDKILSYILSLGKTVKVTGPETLVQKIKKNLLEQKKLFGKWKGLDLSQDR